MNHLKRISIIVVTAISLIGCKKDNPQEDGVYLTANSSKPFSTIVSIYQTDNTTLEKSERKNDLTAPYTFSLSKIAKGKRISILVMTAEGTAITAELKVKGMIIKPRIDSEHSADFFGNSAKEWEYVIQ